MATFAIGDVQGCYSTLRKLVAQLPYDKTRDKLWLAGDLVNRGPRSLDVLRWVRDQGDGVVVVLGNHEIHTLARADGVSPKKKRDTLDAVFDAADRDELMAWLRRRPLLHRDGAHVLIHAGVLPVWSVADAERAARATEQILAGPPVARQVMLTERDVAPRRWDETAPELVRAKITLNVLTRLRVCTPDGAMRLDFDGRPVEAPPGTVPWFSARPDGAKDVFVCGHWSMLGFELAPNRISLDSGCVYGNVLTAVRLEDRKVWTERCADDVRSR